MLGLSTSSSSDLLVNRFCFNQIFRNSHGHHKDTACWCGLITSRSDTINKAPITIVCKLQAICEVTLIYQNSFL